MVDGKNWSRGEVFPNFGHPSVVDFKKVPELQLSEFDFSNTELEENWSCKIQAPNCMKDIIGQCKWLELK